MRNASKPIESRATRGNLVTESHHNHNYPLIERKDSVSVTALLEYQFLSDRKASRNQYWPKSPQPLRRYYKWTNFSLIVDVVGTLLPVLFIFIACAALHLDGAPRSSFGDRLIEGTKYGTTAFPVVFAATIARLLRVIALRKCESGAKLGLLEQLMGSQSLAGTVERFFTLGRYDITGILLLLLWILSPFGSQMTLRLLELRSSYSSATWPIQYLNTSEYSDKNTEVGSSFETASGLENDLPALNSLMGASVLSSRAIDSSPVDTWNNLKIPQLDDATFGGSEQSNGWIQADQNTNHTWISLLGIMVKGLPNTGSSTFSLESSYMDVHCPDSMRLSTSNLKQRLSDSGIKLVLKNASAPWVPNNEIGDWSSMFLDINGLSLNGSNDISSNEPRSVVFGSIVASLDAETQTIDIFDCTLTTTHLESNVSCDGSSCGITQVRRSLQDRRPPSSMILSSTNFESMLTFIPGSLGYPHPDFASPMDNYLLGANNPFSLGAQPFRPNGYADVPGSFFARRLTTVLNTAYQASLCPYGTALGSDVNFTACQLDSMGAAANLSVPGAQELATGPVANATAINILETPMAIYATTKWHAIILLVISLLLQLAAFATMILVAFTRAPNILGFVSSLTRDNPYMAHVVPAGGSALDGAERARALGEVRVRLTDSKPGSGVGKVVFMGVDGSGGRQMTAAGKLVGGGRVYE